MPLTYTAEHFWFVQIPDGYALYQPLLAQKRTGETLRANREKLAAKHVAEPVTPTPDYEFKSICIMFHHGATKFEAQITLRFEETRDTANKETYDWTARHTRDTWGFQDLNTRPNIQSDVLIFRASYAHPFQLYLTQKGLL